MTFTDQAIEFYLRAIGPDRYIDPAECAGDFRGTVENLYIRYLVDDGFRAWFHAMEAARAERLEMIEELGRSFHAMLFPDEAR